MPNITLAPDPGVRRGANLDAAPHEIPDGMGRYLQDVLLDIPGVVRQRGPIDGLNTGTNPDFPSLPTNARIIGMTTLADPSGTDSFRLLLITANKNTGAVEARIYGRSTTPAAQAFHSRAFFEMMDPFDQTEQKIGDPFLYFDDRRSALNLIGQLLAGPISLGLTVQNSEADPFFNTALALDGGALVGIGMNFGADTSKANHRAMFHWRGAAKADYAMGGAVTVAGTQNSPAIVGVGTTFTTSVEPGMFLVDTNGRTLGVVKSITDNTHLTLEQNLLNITFAARNTDKFVSLRRPFSNPGINVAAGSITTSITSPTVNGGGTKFVDQGVANGDLLFRESDFTYIGTVSGAPASNGQLTLAANAAVALAAEGYVATRSAPWAAGSEPVFSTYYNGMQLLANADNQRGGINERSRIFVTEVKNLEGLDLTKTGTFYDLPSTKPHTDIKAMLATESAALVWLAEATYGLFGNDPAALSPKVVYNDGLLSPMSVQPYQGGAIWAGYRSVYWFDGATVQDLLRGKAATAHQKALAGLDYSKLRCWSMLHNRHYICFLQTVNGGVFSYEQGRQNSLTQGAVTYDPTSIIYAINMDTGAFTLWSNVTVRGYSAPPGKLVNTRDAYYVVESSETAGPIICSAESLFQETGTRGFVSDEFLTNPKVVDFAPHFYVEGKLNTYGDPERLKRAQMLLAQYSLYGGTDTVKLGIDLVKGMGEDTKALNMKARTSSAVTTPTTWSNKRSRFSTKANLFGVRFYTMNDGAPAAARLGPWSLGWKWLRPGRV